MKDQLFMAVDLGTSFIKTTVYSLDGTRIAGASEPVRDERPGPGIFIQRGEYIFDSVCGCLKKTAEALGGRASSAVARRLGVVSRCADEILSMLSQGSTAKKG